MKRVSYSVAILAAFLTACGGGGGGGGGGSSAPPVVVVPPTPAPTVAVSLSASKIKVGETAVLTWSSTNATSCTGLDSTTAGIKPVSGTETITATAGGQYKYTLSCDGAGGTFKQTASLAVPYPVLKTSYANKNRSEITDTIMPDAGRVGLETTTSAYFHNRPFGVADFTQEGKFSVMAFQTQFSTVQMKSKGLNDAPNKTFILQRNSAGNYVDITDKLIPVPSERYVCVTPTYVQVADFNNDGKPDAFISCTGPDFQINGVWVDALTPQYAYMSQSDGTYKQWKSSFTAVSHQCSAGDVNADSNVDVVCVDPGKTPYTLLGDGKGSFTRDDTRFPNLVNKAAGGIELVDPGTGVLDVFIAGVPPGADTDVNAAYNNVFIKNNGNGYFNVNTPQILPTSLSPKMVAQGKNFVYSAFHDIVVNNGFIYLLQYDYLYTSMAIRKINVNNFSDNSIIFENLGTFTGWSQYVSLMKPTADGYLVPLMGCDLLTTDVNFSGSACAVKVKM